jgi:sulfite exporter TauE/SafE/copper chaperone CopZ
MHCPSCEAIVEKRVRSLDGVNHAEASMSKGTVTITTDGDVPDPQTLCALFPDDLYRFSSEPDKRLRVSETILAILGATAFIALIFTLSASGILHPVMIDRNSSNGAFFMFGLIAGLSTCAALVGSLVLALSSQWQKEQSSTSRLGERLRPQLLFSTGRIASYALAGGLLGLFGESVQLSSGFSKVLLVAVSLLMLVIGLQMVGFTPFNSVRLSLPKNLTSRIASGRNSTSSMIHPLPAGFMTVLLPCGFTLAAEGAAILSGSLWRGVAIMSFFVLGTLPPLLLIGLSSSGFATRPAISRLFMKSAGLLVLFFTLFNLNSQFGFAGRFASRDTSTEASAQQKGHSDAPRIIRTASGNGTLATTRFELRKGEKVRFIVDATDNGSGCMNAIMVPGLWNQAEYLIKGKPVVLEFTPSKPGTYPITCAMGMPWGVINVK